MELDATACYRAIASRDARFDGRFFTGVVTTGVYCRPVCPARVPLARNVRFYPSAAAAEAAGFRPCLRCRPEASPGTPAWLGTSATVSRALRHIEAGALDQGSVEDLAARLGVGERHLRRLFIEHLGAPPLAVAQTRRVQLAKKLIDDTDLSMARIALDAGFPSVRRFNAAIRRIYGRSAGDLRRAGSARAARGPARALHVKLTFRPPLEWRRLMAYMGPRAIPGVEQVAGDRYRRALRMGDAEGIVEVQPVPRRAQLELVVPPALHPHLLAVVHRARRVFDLGADPREIVGHLRADRALARRLGRRRDVRVPGAWSGFEVAARAIIGQQISVRAATSIAGRLARGLGVPLAEPDGAITHTFPAAEVVAAADLVAAGLIATRARTLGALADGVARGELPLDVAPDLDHAIASLTARPGIGPWTAHYVAMRAMGEPDAFPAGDLGLRKAMAERGTLPAERRLEQRSESWRPWRAYAAMLLWTSEEE